MNSYKQLFENNEKWINKKTQDNKDFFLQLSKEQNPDYLYIG
jgi:carbonic anhydrase